MKKTTLLLFGLLLCISSLAQPITDFFDECIEPKRSDSSSRYLCKSEDGYWFPTKGTYRMLVVFINIIYDVPNINPPPPIINNPDWPVSNQEGMNLFPPTQYFKGLFDENNTLPRQGFFTRFMSECSFDNLVIMADFTTVEINHSRIQANGGHFGHSQLINTAITYINSCGGLQAHYGNNAIGNYDNASIGSPPSQAINNKIDYVAFFALNTSSTEDYGGFARIGSGVTSFGGINDLKLSNGVMYPIESWTAFGIGNGNLKNSSGVFVHEFAHGLLGGNAFHTSGGNHTGSSEYNTFMAGQAGYGLFSAECAFRSCNAYERWRVGWRHPSNAAYKIAANGTNSNILTKFSGTQSFYLRDFVTYGDVIRIKLPYKDSEDASNQYIWLENHQLGKNGKLDGNNFYYYPGITCIPLGTPGIYSFIQVGRDVLEGQNDIVYFSEEKDNLRMINAEGNYNIEYLNKRNDCISWAARPTFEYLSPNPISGVNDQNEAIKTNHQNPQLQPLSDFSTLENKIKNGTLYNQLIWTGDIFDAFVSGSVMDVSSNPPPINAYTYYSIFYYSNYIKGENYRDTRKKYLTGLSIKMNYAYTLNGTDVFKVDVRWDDYDVKQDVNWAGNIILKEQLFLLPNKTITLEQNLTPYQIDRDPISGVFAPPTLFTCENDATFYENSNSHVIVKDKSKMLLKSGSKYIISEGADLTIKAGSTLEVEDCARFEINGQLIVENGAIIIFHPNAEIVLQSLTNILYSGNISQLIYPYVWENPNISSNTTINQPKVYSNDIVIQSGITLTVTSTIKMTNNCKITVQPGGKLIIDGGTLTNACPNTMWQGITVLGNSRYSGVVQVINNGTIMNAITGITANNGGKVETNEAQFINNTTGVLCYVSGSCSFTLTTFELKNNYFGHSFIAHIHAQNSTKVSVYGCTFLGTGGGNGIKASNTYLEVKEYCPAHAPINTTTTTCSDKWRTPSRFSGFGNGIYHINSGVSPTLIVRYSKFSNCVENIYIAGSNYFEVIKNDFDIIRNGGRGMFVRYATGYKIEENIFRDSQHALNKPTMGIMVQGSGSDENEVYKNEYYNLHIGQEFSDKNSSQIDTASCQNCHQTIRGAVTGVQTLCNLFEQNYSTDILVPKSASIRKDQGSALSPAGNRFNGTPLNIDNSLSQHPIDYYYRNSNNEFPDSVSNNVNRISVSSVNGCPSKIAGPIIIIYDKKGEGGIEENLAQYNKWNTEYEYWLAQLLKFENEQGEEYKKILDQVLYFSALKENYFNSIIVAVMGTEGNEAESRKQKEEGEEGDSPSHFSSLISYETLRFLFNYRGHYSDNLCIVETYLAENNFGEALVTLAKMYEKFELTSEQVNEVTGLRVYVYWLQQLEKEGKNIYELSEKELDYLVNFVKTHKGRGVVFAHNILCGLYEICIEDEMIRGLDDKTIKGLDDKIDLRQSVESASSACHNITLVPNPTTGELTITNYELEITNVEIFDIYGKKHHLITSSSHHLINIVSLPAGLYFVKISTETGEVVKKIIKQ